MKNKITQNFGFLILTLCAGITVLFLGSIIYFIASRGWQALSWEFLTAVPRSAMTKGGIAPAIVGTFYLTLGAVLFALPMGLACAVYLTEYSPKGLAVHPVREFSISGLLKGELSFTVILRHIYYLLNKYVFSNGVNLIRISVNNLAGVPSVVFGLFGLAFFVKFLGFGVSILSRSLTLGILILPAIISASQEALIAVPQSLREASLALGATQWQTIKKIVVPTALPGILTGVIIGIGRAAGETAPILFTAATFYMRGYPDSPLSEAMALPYHIYALMTEGAHPEQQTVIAYGCSLVLLMLVLSMSAMAIYFRQKNRSSYGH